MSNSLDLPDSRKFAIGMAIRSAHFLITTMCGVACVAFDGYLLYRHWHGKTLDAIVFLGGLILFPLVVQYLQAVRLYARIRDVLSLTPSDGDVARDELSAVLRIAGSGLADVVF